MIGCHGNRRPSGSERPTLSLPLSRKKLFKSHKTPRIQLRLHGRFCAEAFPIKASDKPEIRFNADSDDVVQKSSCGKSVSVVINPYPSAFESSAFPLCPWIMAIYGLTSCFGDRLGRIK